MEDLAAVKQALDTQQQQQVYTHYNFSRECEMVED